MRACVCVGPGMIVRACVSACVFYVFSLFFESDRTCNLSKAMHQGVCMCVRLRVHSREFKFDVNDNRKRKEGSKEFVFSSTGLHG